MQKKFIIYGQSRSGGTLVRELMNGQANIHCDGELLNYEWRYVRSRMLLRLIKIYPFPYFDYMRRKAAQDIYGFKLLFYQPRLKRYVLSRLQRTGWKFIHVYRQNIVHQAFSKLIATKTRYWHRKEGDKAPDYRVNIGVDEIKSEIELRKRWTAKEWELISGTDRLDVIYETELMEENAWPSTTSKISTYLGIVPFAPARVELRRTDERPYSEVVANYAEIRDYLRGSQYDRLLA